MVLTMEFARRWLRAAAMAAVFAAALVFSASAQAPLDVRVALVIGNSAYANTSPLSNPANDARAMGDTLRGLGFTVVELRDGQKTQMAEAIEKVGAALKGKQGVGMLYYAGHGLQLDWRNYMVPVDANLSKVSDVPTQTIDVSTVIDVFKAAGNRINILVLDACRDNPFTGTASGKGLAQVDAPPGTILAYATAPGNVASDGDTGSANGLYTQFLLDELKRPVTRIEDVFKRVRLKVRQKSDGRQVPWESTSLEEDFFFNTGKVMAVAKPDPKVREAAFSQEKADWEKITDSRNPEDFFAFLQRYPNGFISEQATFALERLAKAKIKEQLDKNGTAQMLGEPRYRVGEEYVQATIDNTTGKEILRVTNRVTKIENGLVYIDGNGQEVIRTLDGGIVRIVGGQRFDPPRVDLPGDAWVVGKKWTSRTIQTDAQGRSFWREDDIRIVAFESVQVRAGTFKAYKFVMDSKLETGVSIRLIYWNEPGWGASIKTLRDVKPVTGKPIQETIEMVSWKRPS